MRHCHVEHVVASTTAHSVLVHKAMSGLTPQHLAYHHRPPTTSIYVWGSKNSHKSQWSIIHCCVDRQRIWSNLPLYCSCMTLTFDPWPWKPFSVFSNAYSPHKHCCQVSFKSLY